MKLRSLVCFVTNKCNYRCPYCNQYENKGNYVDAPASAWLDLFNKIPNPLIIDITGGEPFSYPGIIELIKNMPARHRVAITTNASMLEGKYDLLPRFCHITLSFHPTQVDSLNNFFSRLEEVRKYNGFVSVNVVSWPGQLDAIEPARKKCDALGVTLHVDRCTGVPYTPEEWDRATKLIAADRMITLNLPLPLLCSAGSTYRIVRPDGRSQPCSCRPIDFNLFNDLDKLPEDMHTCRSSDCGGCDYDAVELRSLNGQLIKSGK